MKKFGLLVSMLILLFGMSFGQQTYDLGEIYGHVYDESRKPLAGMKVELSGGSSWAETDKNGYYCIKGVSVPGRYTLEVRYAEGYFPAVVQVIIDSAAQTKFEADIILRARSKGMPSQSSAAAAAKPLNMEVAKELAKAKEAVKNKKPDEAIVHIQKAMAMEPGEARLHYELAVLLRQTGKLEEALAAAEKAAQLQPDFPPVMFFLGETLQILKAYEKSNECLLKIQTSAGFEESPVPIKARVQYLLGVNYFNLQQPDKAIPFLSRSIETDPKIDPNAFIMLGNSYVMVRDGVNSIKCYKKYVELYPDASNILQVKAILEKLESMYKEENK